MNSLGIRVAAGVVALLTSSAVSAEPRLGIAMHGAPVQAGGFDHFPYVNPGAPKGGRATFAVQGSFDSLNPMIVRGVAAAGVREYVYESLMARALDEPFSLYGLLAESIDTPDDRSSVTFTLRPEAKFSDGKPVTVDDVIFSHRLLRDHGRPNYRAYYAKVQSVEKVGDRAVRFVFKSGDREMPLIMGLMPILPRHAVGAETFENSTLKPPIGSGPYMIAEVAPGAGITYRRDPNWWGADLPVNRGLYNFDEVRYSYFRDSVTMFEAFKTGLYQVRAEDDPTRWAKGYGFPALRDGRVVRTELPIGVPAGMSALVFNTRRPFFSDPRVREALILLFDFEWANQTLYHGLYARTQSYFERSELSSRGIPADERERALLAPFHDAVRPDILDGAFKLHATDASGRDREARRRALALLDEAGYVVVDNRLVSKATGAPFTFELLAATRAQQRLFLAYQRNLKQVGIETRIRQVDSAQYQRRKQTFDFDMIQTVWAASLSPGNEQSFRWSSHAADIEGTFNYPGVKSSAVDAMIDAMLSAGDRPGFVAAVRALDRVLLSGNYVIPLFYLPKQWVAYWTTLDRPAETPISGYQTDSWWMARKPQAAATP